MRQSEAGWMCPLHCESASMQAFPCIRRFFFLSHAFVLSWFCSLVSVCICTSTFSRVPPRVSNSSDARCIRACYVLYLHGCTDVCLQRDNFLDIIANSIWSFLTICSFERATDVAHTLLWLLSPLLWLLLFLWLLLYLSLFLLLMLLWLIFSLFWFLTKSCFIKLRVAGLCHAGMDSRGTDDFSELFFFN